MQTKLNTDFNISAADLAAMSQERFEKFREAILNFVEDPDRTEKIPHPLILNAPPSDDGDVFCELTDCNLPVVIGTLMPSLPPDESLDDLDFLSAPTREV